MILGDSWPPIYKDSNSLGAYLEFICLDPCTLNMFHSLDPIWIDISLFIGCFVETPRNYSILSLAFISSSFRVIEENLIFETVQSGPYSSFECFLCS